MRLNSVMMVFFSFIGFYIRQSLKQKGEQRNLTFGCSGFEEKNISIFYDVFLSFGHDFTLGFDCCFISIFFFENAIVVNYSLDEGLFEICYVVRCGS